MYQHTASEQALEEDRSARTAKPEIPVTSKPLFSNALVTLKSSGSKPLASTQAAKALVEVAIVNFMLPVRQYAEDAGRWYIAGTERVAH